MKLSKLLVPSLALAAVFGIAASHAVSAPQRESKQKVVVHLSHFTDNLHAVKMAVHLAVKMQELGAEMTLLLDLEGVRLADSRQPQELIWGKGEPISQEAAAFVKLGGQMLLCPHCAAHCGITATHLRPGARIGKDGELARTILAADKVLDY